jgi:hypothetical protein
MVEDLGKERAQDRMARSFAALLPFIHIEAETRHKLQARLDFCWVFPHDQ